MTGEGAKRHSKERLQGKQGGGVGIPMPKSPKVQIQKSKKEGRETDWRRAAKQEAEGQTVSASDQAITTVVQSRSQGEIQKKEGKRKGKVESRKVGKEGRKKVRSGKEWKEGSREICAWGSAPRGKEGVIHQNTAHLCQSAVESLRQLHPIAK